MTLFSVVLFFHVTAVLGLFAALSFEALSLFHLRRVSTLTGARRWIEPAWGLLNVPTCLPRGPSNLRPELAFSTVPDNDSRKENSPPARLGATTTVHGCLLSACPVVNSTQRVVGSKENTSRGTSTTSAFFSQVDYFWIARNLPELAAGAEITSYKPT